MDLATIELDRSDAMERFREYREAVRARHSEEDAAIMRGYRELAKGTPLISLRETIDQGGINAQGKPALAVIRATAEWCYLDLERTSWRDASEGWTVTFSETSRPSPRAKHSIRRVRGVYSRDEIRESVDGRSTWGWRAMVPIIPPRLRPARGLARYHILWEVEQWERAPRPPGDPALLRQISGDVYAVVATWDLTPLEQLVLARRNS